MVGLSLDYSLIMLRLCLDDEDYAWIMVGLYLDYEDSVWIMLGLGLDCALTMFELCVDYVG